MTNGSANGVQHHELSACQTHVENKIVVLETQISGKLSALQRELDQIRLALDTLVTKTEFWPVKMFSFGLAGGILLSALGTLLGRVLGWQ